MPTTRQYNSPEGHINETTNTTEHNMPFPGDGYLNQTTSTAVAEKLPPPKTVLQAVNRASTY